MAKKFARKDFLLKDLVVSIGAGGRAGTWLPADDGEVPPSPISPIAGALFKTDLIEAVRVGMLEAVKVNKYEDIARAFVSGEAGGNPAIRSAIHEIGSAVVASAAFASLGGAVGLPNPDCGGTSLETIPPTLTPIVHIGLAVHRVADLPRLRKQLVQTMDYVEKAAAAQAPRGDEVSTVRDHLEGALKSLGR